MKLSVVIPALNEENGIADIIERVLAIAEPLADAGVPELELIVVDDGSQDQTAKIIKQYQNVVLIQHKVNRGYGAAIKTGFREASGNLLAFLDADGTYPPEYFPHLCKALLKEKADLVVGSRMAGAGSDMPLVRRIGNTIFATLVSVISNRRVTDSASGQRVLRVECLDQLYPLPDGLNFTPVMSTRAMHENIRVIEVPIPYAERVGRSKLSVVHDGMRFLNSILMTALTYNPARILAFISLGLIGAGLVAGLLAVSSPSINHSLGGRYPALFAALVLASLGVNLFSIGTTFNYLVSLFHKRQIRQGIFSTPIFRHPLEFDFGWLGLVVITLGLATYVLSVWFGLTASGQPAPWFAPAVSTIFVLTGTQLVASWLLTVVLAELSQRESKVASDLTGSSDQVVPASEPVISV